MVMKTETTYKDAGVDVQKADTLIDRLKKRIESTFAPHVLSPLGGFAALSELPDGYQHPVLVTSTDGVGTKLRIAFLSGSHETVGIDLVAMCVNDILTLGARPFLFLDYFACGTLDEKIYADVISGICAGCEMADSSLVGGETAEMPSFYKEGEYELAGFSVGVVEKGRIVDGSSIAAGDRVIGLASSGLHSNGFSLVRKIVFDIHKMDVRDRVEGLDLPLFRELLKPTRIYVKSVLSLLGKVPVKGMAHITGGGLPGNFVRVLPEGVAADLVVPADRVHPIFRVLQELGNVPREDMIATFNMGIGFVLVVAKEDEERAMRELTATGEDVVPLGVIRKREGRKEVVVRLG